MICCQVSFAEWDKDIPLSSDNLTDFPVDNQSNLDAIDLVLSNYRKGMAITYSSASTVVVSAGQVVCSNSGGTVRKFRSNPSNTNVTFSDLDTGSEAAATTYYVFANCDAVADTATFKLSLSSSAPSGVTSYKLLGSIYNNSSSDIDRHFIYSEPYGNINADSSGAEKVEAIYDYGTSTSTFTSKTGGLLIAYGSQSVSAASSATITNLPFSGTSTYQCFVNTSNGSTDQTENSGCVKGSGSSITIYNEWPSGATTLYWFAIGY